MQDMVTSVHKPDNQTNYFSFWYDHRNDFEDRRSEFFNRKINSLKDTEKNNQEIKEKDRPLNFTPKNNLFKTEEFSKKSQERQNIISARNKYAYVKSKTDSNIESLNLKRRKLRNTNFLNESDSFFSQHDKSVGYLQRQRNVMSALPANRVHFYPTEPSIKPHYRSKSAISLRNIDGIKENESLPKGFADVDIFHNGSVNKYFKQDHNLKPLLNNSASNFQQNEVFEKSNKSFVDKERYYQLSSRFGNPLNDNISNTTTENSVLLSFLRDDPQMKSWSYNLNTKFDKDSDPIKYSGAILVDTSNRDFKATNDASKNVSTLSTEYTNPNKKIELSQNDKNNDSHEIYDNKYNSHLEIKNKMLSLLESLNLNTLKSNIIEIERRATSSRVPSHSSHESTLDIYHLNKHDLNNWDHLRNRPLVKNKKSVRVALENNRLHCYTPEYDKPKLSSVYT